MATRDPAAAFLRAFGRAVRARRTDQKLSQEDFGFRSGLDRTYVSGVERGVRNPTLRIVFRIAVALDVDPEDLMADARALSTKGEGPARARIASDRPR